MAESAQEVMKELTAAGLLSADHATEFVGKKSKPVPMHC
jgi:polyhydroxyalkanoate synthesis regulator phasin